MTCPSILGVSALFVAICSHIAQCQTTFNLVAKSEIQNFSSYGYPNNGYKPNSFYRWNITKSSPTDTIYINVLSFDIQDSVGCVLDNVTLYDASNTWMKTLCGSQQAGTKFNTNTDYMVVDFKSDSQIEFSGFLFGYNSASSEDCSNVSLYATRKPQNFTSLNYPNNYPLKTNCTWHIETSITSDVIVLRVIDFQIRSQYDSRPTVDVVSVYDGKQASGQVLVDIFAAVPDYTVISAGSAVTVAFFAISNVTAKGFKFEYTSQTKAAVCKEANLLATDIPQYLLSPNYPFEYPHNITCQWNITAASPSDIVHLLASDFALYNGKLDIDNVIFYEGATELGTLSNYQDAGQVFESTGPYMTVVFKTNTYASYGNFRFVVTSIKNIKDDCSNVSLHATRTPQYFTSLNYPNNYPVKTNCEWHIETSTTSDVIVLKVIDFELGICDNPNVDYVSVYDGKTTSDQGLVDIYGTVPNDTYISVGSALTIVFHAKCNVSARGLKFEYTSQDKTVALCGKTSIYATEFPYYIVSPNYPAYYDNKVTCQWNITAYSPSDTVHLLVQVFNKFDGQPNLDNVTIYDGSTEVATLSSVKDVNRTFDSTGRFMTVVYRINTIGSFGIFKFEITSSTNIKDQNTTVDLEATHLPQYLTSHNYPNNYPSKSNLIWKITALFPSEVINLVILDFALEFNQNCTLDSVSIYDGNSTSSTKLQTLCGPDVTSTLTNIKSTGNTMTIVFQSNDDNSYKGFQFQYTAVTKSTVCGEQSLWASDVSQLLTSPNYGTNNYYPNNINCQYVITSKIPSNVVSLKVWDFSMGTLSSSNCTNDKVILYDGSSTASPTMSLLCGTLASVIFTSSGLSMTVVIQTDNKTSADRGFKFEYVSQKSQAECTTNSVIQAYDNVRYITSPGYPNAYLSNSFCQWVIKSYLPNYAVQLKVIDLTIETNDGINDCSSDFVNVYDGDSTSNLMATSLCGQIKNKVFISTGSNLTVLFNSGPEASTGSFKLEYSALLMADVCADVHLSAVSFPKYFYSPGFPVGYPSNLNCSWRITSSPLYLIQLKPISFDISSYCAYDSVTLYDGNDTNAIRKIQYCGTTSSPFLTLGNTLIVTFRSLNNWNDEGFQFEYTTVNKSVLCGPTQLTASQSSKYISPAESFDTFPSNIHCEWHISSFYSSDAISLRIGSYHINDAAANCNNQYLTLYDGDSTSSSRIDSLCDNVYSASFTSTGMYMTVVYHSEGVQNATDVRLFYSVTSRPDYRAPLDRLDLSLPRGNRKRREISSDEGGNADLSNNN